MRKRGSGVQFGNFKGVKTVAPQEGVVLNEFGRNEEEDLEKYVIAPRRSRGPEDFDLRDIEIADVDWSKEVIDEVRGYDYQEHEAVQNLTTEDVALWRNSWHMTVEASDPSARIPKPIRSFEESRFPEDILNLLDVNRGGEFESPTPVQSQGWPLIMTGKDVIGVAQTGSGKTLAFILPGVMHIRMNDRQKNFCPTVMIQAPTRELARQIADEARSFAKGVRVGHSFGGEGRRIQEEVLKKAQLVVGTPGRTMDHLSRRFLNLRHCTYLVLDEADRMLDMGFQPQVEKIFRCVRPGRQLLMFTATWPNALHMLASKLFKMDWLKLTIGALQTTANHNVTQKFSFVNGQIDKMERLCELLSGEFRGQKTLIFVQTRRQADEVCMTLRRKMISTAALHGGKAQQMRDLIVSDFKRGNPLRTLIATDVAQRGLHVEDIGLVVNYDFPNNVEDYVHRIGRTARQGKKGTSVTFFNLRFDTKHIDDLVKVLKEAHQPIPREFTSQSFRGRGRGRGGYVRGGRYNSSRYNSIPEEERYLTTDSRQGDGEYRSKSTCYQYLQGNCHRGDKCRFVHSKKSGGNSGGYGGW